MKTQTLLILGLAAALIIAVFAVINVDSVEVNYLFGTAEWPLILVILGSVLMGAVIVGSLGMVRMYRMNQEVKQWKHEAEQQRERQSEETNSRAERLRTEK
ncbi:LapA family protein [Alteribacillus iranensis]|uniref:Uncharacterized integral membrane protein n=1 Tax=Alteribacillus iranensis TaxID=930128 RepID=A0A1I1ZAK0_9BACI|nr:lipopolysaccharide assembly protein LapA domain-containing protein [Alteribacillus iranensis]SFE27360.1 Uncharacterized integral membrane protein [Alteribacillus iranensis]